MAAAEKPSKRDLDQSRADLFRFDSEFQLNSRGRFEGRPDYLHVENTDLAAADVAERIIQAFGLRQVESGVQTP